MSENDIVKNSSEPVVEDNELDLKPKIDKLGRAYATGRRKTSVSRVWIKNGNKKITVNGKVAINILKGKYIIQFSKNPYLKLKI